MDVTTWTDLLPPNISPSVPIRVLVVEDNPFDEELLRRQLQKTQIADSVIFASTASQALELFTGPEGEAFRRDLLTVILDIHLPDMSGIELLKRVRTISGMEDFPVIVMTSSNDPRDIEECKKLKVMSYIEKPVTFSSFSNTIANIFHQAQEDNA